MRNTNSASDVLNDDSQNSKSKTFDKDEISERLTQVMKDQMQYRNKTRFSNTPSKSSMKEETKVSRHQSGAQEPRASSLKISDIGRAKSI